MLIIYHYYLYCSELELVQHHGEAGIQSPEWAFEIIQVTVENEVKHLHKGEKCKKKFQEN